MTTIDTGYDAGPAERVRFFPRQLVRADDLNDDQAYHRARQREHNRFLHGWGVVCGCDVQPASTTAKPWRVRICPGYLLTPQGDAVRIRREVLFDIADCFLQSEDPCAFARPCPPMVRRALEESSVHLAVRHLECEARPVRVAPVGCTCDETDCEYSRIRDGYELCCLADLPATHVGSPYDCEALLGGHHAPPCPDCPSDPWVVLATIRLPALRNEELIAVDPVTNRRILYSTAALQALIRCVQGLL
jgi:hypothetical protein